MGCGGCASASSDPPVATASTGPGARAARSESSGATAGASTLWDMLCCAKVVDARLKPSVCTSEPLNCIVYDGGQWLKSIFTSVALWKSPPRRYMRASPASKNGARLAAGTADCSPLGRLTRYECAASCFRMAPCSIPEDVELQNTRWDEPTHGAVSPFLATWERFYTEQWDAKAPGTFQVKASQGKPKHS